MHPAAIMQGAVPCQTLIHGAEPQHDPSAMSDGCMLRVEHAERHHPSCAGSCREQYAEMREEFYAGLEDRKYLSLGEARKRAAQASFGECGRGWGTEARKRAAQARLGGGLGVFSLWVGGCG